MKNFGWTISVLITVFIIAAAVYLYFGQTDTAPAIQQIGTAQVETICTIDGSITFVARDRACATVSKLDNGQETVTFRGKTSGPFEYVQVAFYTMDFSPDGKHLAYTASNVPIDSLPRLNETGDRLAFKPQRFVVADKKNGPVYDDIYYPQYSPDGKHLGYCGYKGGELFGDGKYVVVIDGIETKSVNKITDCEDLFGKQEEKQINAWEATAPDGSLKLEVYFDPEQRRSNNCLRGHCQVYISLRDSMNLELKKFGPFETITGSVFSPDSKHYAFFGERWYSNTEEPQQVYEPSSIFIDGEKRSVPYSENGVISNMAFSNDSKTLHFNAQNGNEVYYVIEPIEIP